MTFGGLSRLRVKKSRDFGLGMVTPGARGLMPKVGGPMAPKRWTLRGAPGVSHQLASKSSLPIRPPKHGWFGTVTPEQRPPAVVPHGGEITCIDIYISQVDGGEAIRQAPPLL